MNKLEILKNILPNDVLHYILRFLKYLIHPCKKELLFFGGSRFFRFTSPCACPVNEELVILIRFIRYELKLYDKEKYYCNQEKYFARYDTYKNLKEQCQCGSSIFRRNYSNHITSKNHLNHVNKLMRVFDA